ncbi:MAG TPA: iron-sulfur cluster repair di-iron protein [Bacteroidia bacterium]|nr:iron-sulfur cluster repair di-iron protein [Bacteroidia bacterium]
METKDLTLKELVIKQPESAALLEKYGLDFCCKGGRTIRDACESKGLNYAEVEKEISNLINRPHSEETDFAKMEPDALIDNILQIHHSYVKEIMPVISAHTEKVARVHGEHHPEVIEIAKLFAQVKSELEHHMMKEEKILFPHIKLLAEAKRKGQHVEPPSFGTIRNPIRMMETEHESAGSALEEIKNLSSSFIPPADACTTYRVSFMELEKFTKDLHLHIHKENNILFPKAIALESKLLVLN